MKYANFQDKSIKLCNDSIVIEKYGCLSFAESRYYNQVIKTSLKENWCLIDFCRTIVSGLLPDRLIEVKSNFDKKSDMNTLILFRFFEQEYNEWNEDFQSILSE